MFVALFISMVTEELVRQQTLDIFDLFYEDFVVIKENMAEILSTFYQELPIIEVIVAFITTIFLLILSIKLIVSIPRIKNKIRSIVKYWLSN